MDRKANSIVLALYLSFILISGIVVSNFYSGAYLVIGSILVLVLSVVLSPLILKLFSKLSLDENDRFTKIPDKILPVFFYGIPFIVLLIYYIAYFPGGFGNDAFAQLEQYAGNSYTDWHPVLHTFLVFWIPLRLTRGWCGSIILFQIIVFAAALGYSFNTVYKFAGRKYVIGTMIYILCNPLLMFSLNAWKDVSFAIGAMFLISFSLKIYVSKGEWLRKPVNTVFFVTAFVLTTIFRHNAVLFTVPLLLALFFFTSKRKFIIILVASAALFGAIKGPLYWAVGVQKADKRQIEMLGLPLTVIGDAVTYRPEALDEDILEFAYQVAPREVWDEYYVSGNFNSVKWEDETDHQVIEEYGTAAVIKMAARCFRECPGVCLASIIHLTEGIYTVTTPHYTDVTPIVEDNYFAIPKIQNSSVLLSVSYAHQSFVQDFTPHVFLYLGVPLLLIVISVLSKCRINKLKDWKLILFAVPVLAYNYGTALLMTGFNDCPRFFTYTVFVLPVLLVFYYRKEDKV